MKSIFFIITIIGITCISCDGRKSRSESLKASIEKFNQRQSKVSLVTIYPREFTEVVTDTLISNKVKVHIKNYSLPDASIVMTSVGKTQKSQKFHRVFESEIVISTVTQAIFNTHISAEQFKAISVDKFWNNATLQQVWVNQELSTSQTIQLDMSFINPKENSYKLYRMSIDEYGQQHLKLIEEQS
ncbi:MAG: hypothetical protein ABIO60_00965 [Aquaticitalea sp.]